MARVTNSRKIKAKFHALKDICLIRLFYFLLHRAKPLLPPYFLPHPRTRTQNLYSPLVPFLISKTVINFCNPIRHESAMNPP